jgi:hypothetical protein
MIIGVTELDPHPIGQPLDGLGEGQIVDFLEEVDDITALAAGSEAVPEATLRGHLEAGSLLVVKRAQALEGSTTGVAQRDVGADHLLDSGTVPDGDDVLVVDPSWHAGIVCSPTDTGGTY